MSKVVVIALIIGVLILGIWAVLSFDLFSIVDDKDISSEPILGKEGEDSDRQAKPPGRDLSIELDEKMGLSAP